MSESKSELFKIVKVKAFGLREKDYFNEEQLYYYQNIFIRGEVSENFPFIKICDESDELHKRLHFKFFDSILALFEEISLPSFDQYSSDDLPGYVLHGAEILALTYCGNIIAIGNNKFWIPVSNFFEIIQDKDIKQFKKKYLATQLLKELDKRNECMKDYERISSYIDSIIENFRDLCDNYKPNDLFKYLINNENFIS